MSKILIIDDNADMLLTLEHLLQFYDYEVVMAENGKIGIELAENEQPDLIIVDALMPVMNGFEACEHLKGSQSTNHIPVIFLSANYTAPKYREKGLDLGADDYMLKPFNAKDLIGKVSSLLHRKNLIEQLKAENASIQAKRDPHFYQTIQQNKEIDQTTGLAGKIHFNQVLKNTFESNTTDAFSVSVADIDQFSAVKDTFGDQTADYVLLKVANSILKNARSGDLVFRLDDHRFAIIHLEVEKDTAANTMSHILHLIRTQHIFDEDFFEIKRHPERKRYAKQELTLSAGISGKEGQSDSLVLFYQATEALEYAKKTGRNKLVPYSEMVSEV